MVLCPATRDVWRTNCSNAANICRVIILSSLRYSYYRRSPGSSFNLKNPPLRASVFERKLASISRYLRKATSRRYYILLIHLHQPSLAQRRLLRPLLELPKFSIQQSWFPASRPICVAIERHHFAELGPFGKNYSRSFGGWLSRMAILVLSRIVCHCTFELRMQERYRMCCLSPMY